MAKKKKIKETTIEDFYDLKIDKVDELVAALKGEDTSEFGDVSMKYPIARALRERVRKRISTLTVPTF